MNPTSYTPGPEDQPRTQPQPQAQQPGYNPQPYTPQGYYQQQPAPQAKRRKKWPWILLGIVLVVGLSCGIGAIALLGSAAKQVDQEIQYGDAEKKAAVKITDCSNNVLGWEVTYTVTNSTNRSQSYLISFEIQDKSGNRVGEAHSAVNDLGPGKTAKDKAIGSVEGKGAKCVLTRVD